MTGYNMDRSKSIPASKSRPYLRRILSRGGSAAIEVGKEVRCFQHFRSLDRPERRLPWPLSRLQPFRFFVRFHEREPGPIISGVRFPPAAGAPDQETEWEVLTFSNKQIEEGIDFFLRDALPDEPVVLEYLPHW
jgi:hypothetical protein